MAGVPKPWLGRFSIPLFETSFIMCLLIHMNNSEIIIVLDEAEMFETIVAALFTS